MADWRLLAAVALGSAIGALLRFSLSLWLVSESFIQLPWSTLTVNVLGSALIGFYAVATEPEGYWSVSPVFRVFVVAGFCGGFTTFSFFSLEMIQMLLQGAATLALAYALLSLLLWLAAGALGIFVGSRLNERAQKSR